MVCEDEDARGEEDKGVEFHHWEGAEVEKVDSVRGGREDCQEEGEAVDSEEEDVQADDELYKSSQDFGGDDGVFFYEFREVVEAGGCGVLVGGRRGV